ncbi:MAG: CDP-alcohol phosphatidyltransferase family protein [Pseudomonadota bacterium]
MTEAAAPDHPSDARPVARYVAASETRVWSMAPVERLRRILARAGVTEVGPWDGVLDIDRAVAGRRHLIVRADHEYAPVLMADLAKRPGTVLLVGGQPVAAHVDEALAAGAAADLEAGRIEALAGLPALEPEALSSAHDKALRKRDVPYAMPIRPDTVDAVERRTFEGSYKGVTDFVTRHVWPVPARAATRWCAARGVSPNTVTTVSLVFVLLAMFLFWQGFFVTGCLVGWAMCFLDTVDGKLARTTLNSSKWGNVYDHGIDLIHPPFWYWAWFVGVGSGSEAMVWSLWVIVVGYVVQRIQEGIFIARFGIEMHVWRRFDSRFRLIVARRNPNLLILMVFAIVGLPGAGFIAVAAWTVIGFVIHSVQIAQAMTSPRPVTSWLAA